LIIPHHNNIEKTDRDTNEDDEPRVDHHHIDIGLDGQVLKIKGEKTLKKEEEDEETEMHTVEHHYGSFFRSFTLPENVDVEEIEADNKNGILYVHLPKNKESKPRRIEINEK